MTRYRYRHMIVCAKVAYDFRDQGLNGVPPESDTTIGTICKDQQPTPRICTCSSTP